MTDALLPHQEFGADFLAYRKYALLADEPGAGKTAQIVEASRRIGARSILVLCPVSVREHWAREFQKWGGRTDITVQNGRPKSIPQGILITGHSAMAKEETVKLLADARWDLVVVDECHAFCNVTSARTVYLLGATEKALWHHVDRMWLVTGSPLVNSGADLYPACASLFSGGQTVPYDWFINRYTTVIPDNFNGSRPTGLINEDELKAWLRPHMLRRADFLDLPPKTLTTLPLQINDADLVPIVAALNGVNFAAVNWELEQGLDPDESISRVRRALGSAKVPATADYIAELVCCGFGPVVGFYHHKDVGSSLFSILKTYGLRVSWIDGSVVGDKRTAAIDWFQDGRLDVLLVQEQAGGTGITLTRSNRAVVIELPWTAVMLEQIIARVHRITQTRHVIADILSSNCWLDAVMAQIIVRKATAAKLLLTDR